MTSGGGIFFLLTLYICNLNRQTVCSL